MIERLAVGSYRGAMTAAAATAGLASRLPGAPARWRALGARLGRLTDDERTLASGAPAVWLHAASVGELNAARPLLRRLRERFAERLCVVSTLSLTGLELARSSPEAHLALLLPSTRPARCAGSSPTSSSRRSSSPRPRSGRPCSPSSRRGACRPSW